jgi:formamidopyrimidine-DNA glycosylase
MIEIPEAKVIAQQANDILTGKRIAKVFNASSPHKFAWYSGDPATYPQLLEGHEILSVHGHGMFVDICCDADCFITAGDGTNLRYYPSLEACPPKYQLAVEFDNGGCVAFTVAMYGGIWAYSGEFDNKYHKGSLASVSPLEDAFDEQSFENIFRSVAKDLSMKALLATEQRIPGLGNGVLQDILFNSGIHPKRKMSALNDLAKSDLFHSLKTTLRRMTDDGGRDTEKDFTGQCGGYKTRLSKNTVNNPCPDCGGTIVKEAYLGGAVYYCPVCQELRVKN